MNSHNTSAERDIRQEPVRVIEPNRVEADELSISEEFDQGGDPYNNTGQHVIIKANIDLQD